MPRTKTRKTQKTARRADVSVHENPATKAIAIHVDGRDGTQAACFDGLRVLITKEDGVWLAQGLEVDYAVDGESLQDVKRRFTDGLKRTIEANLRVFNSINPLLKIAPQEVWDEWNEAKNALRRFVHTTAIVVTEQQQQALPYDQIVWLDASQAKVA